MSSTDCQEPSPLERARTLVQKTLGVRRVADWCGVTEDAVYQWLSRGTDASPIPLRHVSAISRGAAAEGLAFDVRVLWPDAPEAVAP